MRDTDGVLLSAARQERVYGRFDAFETLLSRYEKLIYHIAYRYFNNPDDALDLSQEAAVKIYKGLPNAKANAEDSLKSWICAVTANVCLDELRKRKNRPQPVDTDRLSDASSPTVSASAEEDALSRERASDILHAVAQLSDDHRTLIILRDLNGFTYQELAEATGINIQTVKSRLSRARTALTKLLTQKERIAEADRATR